MAYRRKRMTRRPRRRVPRRLIRMKRNPYLKALIPRTHIAKLRYVDQYTFTPVLGGIPVRQIFRCNSLNDPDLSGLGHQPMGYDQLMALYSRSRVVGAKISINFVSSDSTSNNSSAIVGVCQTSTTNNFSDTNTFLEQKNGRYKIVQLGENPRPISLRYSLKKSQGIKNVMDNYEISAVQNANPNIEDFFQVYVSGVSSVQIPSPVRATIQIEYIAVFSDPVDLLAS